MENCILFSELNKDAQERALDGLKNYAPLLVMAKKCGDDYFRVSCFSGDEIENYPNWQLVVFGK